METLIRYMAVAGGGALGAMARYYLSGSALSRAAAPFPTATFVINVTGSFVVGFLLTLVTDSISVSPHLRLAIATGFVGAYTTFSTFEYETAKLVEQRQYLVACLNVALSLVVGFGAVWGGILMARKLEGPQSNRQAGAFELRLTSDGMRSAGTDHGARDMETKSGKIDGL